MVQPWRDVVVTGSLENGGEANNFWDVIEGRRTVRFYRDEPVPDRLLDRLLRAATWHPPHTTPSPGGL